MRGLGCKKLERETGFEPATSTLARSHSTTELLPPVLSFYSTCYFADNSLHPHWHPLFVIRIFGISHSTAVRQETLDELCLGVPCLVTVVDAHFSSKTLIARVKLTNKSQYPTDKCSVGPSIVGRRRFRPNRRCAHNQSHRVTPVFNRLCVVVIIPFVAA
jgi:hypothetical protein